MELKNNFLQKIALSNKTKKISYFRSLIRENLGYSKILAHRGVKTFQKTNSTKKQILPKNKFYQKTNSTKKQILPKNKFYQKTNYSLGAK
jgi:hypothetical protein